MAHLASPVRALRRSARFLARLFTSDRTLAVRRAA
jgi:hypothetical protein